MNTETESKQENGKPAAKEIRVVVDTSANANLLDTARFEHAQRIASSIAYSPLIPEHLRRNKHREFTVQEIQANVMLVVSQALLWDVHPSAIIGETYVVGGRLGYQGKLVAALINAKANLKTRLTKNYTGKPGTDEFAIVITGTFRGEDIERQTVMSVGEAKTENQMWKKNPRLKLWYSGVVQWAREFAPELILGIVTDDDAERMDAWQKETEAQRYYAKDAAAKETPQGLAQSAGKGATRTAKPKFVKTVPMQPHEKLVEKVEPPAPTSSQGQGTAADPADDHRGANPEDTFPWDAPEGEAGDVK